MTRTRLMPILGIVVITLSLGARVAEGQGVPDDPPDTQLPGDQYDPIELPGDQYDGPPLPGGPLDAAPLPDGRSVPTAAPAQQLLLHLPLDGSLAHSGRTGAPRFVTRDGAPPPTYVPGHAGQALSFSGPAAIAAPFALDHAEFPRVTVTAWVREEAGASGSRDIVSSTSTAGARVGIHGGRLAARLGGRGISYGHARFPVGEWVFVAAVFDTAAGSAQLYQNDGEPFVVEGIDVSTSPPPLVSDPGDPASEPQAWIVIGASNFETFGTSSRPLVIDDVRIYGGALAGDQIAGLRDADTGPAAGPTTVVDLDSSDGGFSMSSPNAPAGATSGGALANSDALPTACQSHDDCPDGQYCAIEQACHPDRHAPMHSRDFEPLQANFSGQNALPESVPDRVDQEDEPGSNDAQQRSSGPYGFGNPTFTQVAGTVGGNQRRIDLGENFLNRIRLYRVSASSSPCRIWANDEELDLCRNYPAPNPETIEVALQDSVIGRLSACVGGALLGLQVWGDVIAADGSTRYEPASSRAQFSSCAELLAYSMENWTSSKMCQAGSLATGIVVHSNDLGYFESISGLQLICRQVGLEEG